MCMWDVHSGAWVGVEASSLSSVATLSENFHTAPLSSVCKMLKFKPGKVEMGWNRPQGMTVAIKAKHQPRTAPFAVTSDGWPSISWCQRRHMVAIKYQSDTGRIMLVRNWFFFLQSYEMQSPSKYFWNSSHCNARMGCWHYHEDVWGQATDREGIRGKDRRNQRERQRPPCFLTADSVCRRTGGGSEVAWVSSEAEGNGGGAAKREGERMCMHVWACPRRPWAWKTQVLWKSSPGSKLLSHLSSRTVYDLQVILTLHCPGNDNKDISTWSIHSFPLHFEYFQRL